MLPPLPEPALLPPAEEPEAPVLAEAPLEIGDGTASEALPRSDGSNTIWLTLLSIVLPSPMSRLTFT
jgi:hypothetical protein